MQKDNCTHEGLVEGCPEDPSNALTSSVFETQHTDNGSTDEVEIFFKEYVINKCNLERDLPACSEDDMSGLYHASFVERLTDIEIRICTVCCQGRFCHCPLCPVWLFRPAEAATVSAHLITHHWKKCFAYKGISILRCCLECKTESGQSFPRGHWHCPLCSQTRTALSRLSYHLDLHAKGQTVNTTCRASNRRDLIRLFVSDQEPEENAQTENFVRDSSNTFHNWSETKTQKHCPCCALNLDSVETLLEHLYSGKCRDMVDLIPRDLLKKVIMMDRISGTECPICNLQFYNTLKTKVHFVLNACSDRQQKPDGLTRDPTTKMYHCRHCKFSASFPRKVTMHEEWIHVEKTCACPVCQKMFGSQSVLKEHIRLTHLAKKTRVVCHICGKVVIESNLRRHIHKTHAKNDAGGMEPTVPKERVQCELCDYATSQKELLKKHFSRRHGQKDKVCDICGKAFATVGLLGQHLKTQHSQAQHQYNVLTLCGFCGKRMLARNLQAHVRRVHEQAKDFTCDVCQKGFQTRYTLKIHYESHRKPTDRKFKFICKTCGSGFNNRTVYQDHLNVHSGDRPYLCMYCSKNFRQLTVYHKHLQMHRGIRHSCDVCSRTFSSKNYLLIHQKKHTSDAECMPPKTKNVKSAGNFGIVKLNDAAQTTFRYLRMGMLENIQEVEQTPNESDGFIVANHVNNCNELDVSNELRSRDEIVEVVDCQTKSQFLCNYCQNRFDGMEDINNHMITDHPNN